MDSNIIARKWIQGMTVKPDSLLGQAFTGEEGAHVFRITGETTGGAAVPITGTIAAKFLRSDNITVPLSGSVSDGVAVVTLTDECYLVPGRFIFSIYVIQGDLRMCIYCGVGNVFRTDSGEYEGGQIITDITELINEIQEAVESIPPDYSELTGEVADLKSAVDDMGTVSIDGFPLTKGHMTNAGKWGQLTGGNYYHFAFPVSSGDIIQFKCTFKDTVVGFVTGYSLPLTSSTDVLYSEAVGFTTKIPIHINTLYEWTVPSDAKYLIVEKIYGNAEDVNISVFSVNGYDCTKKLNAQIGEMQNEINVSAKKNELNVQNMGIISNVAQALFDHNALDTNSGDRVLYNGKDLVSQINIVCFDRMVAISPKVGYAFRIFQYGDSGDFVRYAAFGAGETNNVFAAIPKGLHVRLQFFKEDRTQIDFTDVFLNYNIRYIDSEIDAGQIVHPGYVTGGAYNNKAYCSLNYYSPSATGANGKTFVLKKTGTYKQLIARYTDATTYVNNSSSIDESYTLPRNEYYAVSFRRSDSADMTVDDLAELFGNIVEIREPETTIEKIFASLEKKTIDTSTGEVLDNLYSYRISSTDLLTADADIGISTWTGMAFRVFLYDSQGTMIRYFDAVNSKSFAILEGEHFRLTFYKDGSTAIPLPTFVVANYTIKYSVIEKPKAIFSDLFRNGGNLKILGDSITQGVNGTGFAQDGEHIIGNFYRNPNGYCYANLLKASLESTYALSVTNNACRGTSTDWCIKNWGTIVSNTDNVILCMYGTNDRGLVQNKAVSLENFKRIRAMATASGQRIVFMASIPAGLRNETNETHNYGTVYYHMEDIDRNVNIATDGKYVSLYDICSEWVSNNNITLTDYLDSYELHPNDDLYYKMFIWVCKALGIAPKIKNATW